MIKTVFPNLCGLGHKKAVSSQLSYPMSIAPIRHTPRYVNLRAI